MALPAPALSSLTLSTVTVTVDTMNSAVMTDWHAMEERVKALVAKKLERRQKAEFEHQQAEAELERIKRDRRAAEGCCVFHRSGGHKTIHCATVPTSEAGRHEFAAGCNDQRCVCGAGVR